MVMRLLKIMYYVIYSKLRGLLKDSRFTCYPGFECDLNSSHKKADQDGNIITGIGLGGTIEFASLIIKNLLGEEKAQEVLNKIQY